MNLFDLEGLREKRDDLEEISSKEGFWNNNEEAQRVLKEKKIIENKIDEYGELENQIEEIELLLQLAIEEQEESLIPEVKEEYEKYKAKVEELRLRTPHKGE